MTKPRFMEMVELLAGPMETPCWIWTLAPTHYGYGQLNYKGKKWKAHRVAHDLFIGAIPDGMQAHHICEVKLCCNPKHLKLLSLADHRRLHPCLDFGLVQSGKTHCPQGHEYTQENTMRFGPTRARRCRSCENARYRHLRAKVNA